MYHLIYTSCSTLRDLPESGIYHILSDCSRRNKAENITSVLAFRNGIFIGYIEGTKQKVKQLYLRIEADPRHLKCRILAEGTHKGRNFPKVPMGYLSDDETSNFRFLFVKKLTETRMGEINQMFEHAKSNPEYIENRLKHEVKLAV